MNNLFSRSYFERVRLYNRRCWRARYAAGRTVAAFVLGQADATIISVGVAGTRRMSRIVDRQPTADVAALDHVEKVPAKLRPIYRRAVISECIVTFAGPAALWREMRHPAEHWFDNLCNDGLFVGDPDFTRPMALATKVTPSESDALELLRMIARWTDELLDDSRVWQTVELLEIVLRLQGLLNGTDTCRFLRLGWGGDDAIPYLSLRRTWRYRLQVRRR